MQEHHTYNIDLDAEILYGLENPDRPQKGERPLDFSEDCQNCLLAAMLSNIEDWRRFAYVQPQHFIDNGRQLALKLARRYWQTYNTLPTPVELLDMATGHRRQYFANLFAKRS